MKKFSEWAVRRLIEAGEFECMQPGKMLRLKEFALFPIRPENVLDIKAKDPKLLKYLYRGYCKTL